VSEEQDAGWRLNRHPYLSRWALTGGKNLPWISKHMSSRCSLINQFTDAQYFFQAEDQTKPAHAKAASQHVEAIDRFSAQIQESEFMEEMLRRLAAYVPHGVMGRMDCATLYGLVRWHRPTVTVESGGYLGMSSAFILKALADEGLTMQNCIASNLTRLARMGFSFRMN
jgi:hypothetical protein